METHPVHPRDARPVGGHCSPASLSLSFPLCPRRGYVGSVPPVQAWSPVAAVPRPDTRGPGVCPRAACGATSQGLPRPLVPPLPQTWDPMRLCSPASAGQGQVQGWEAWLPRPCVVTFTHLPLTGRRRPPTGVWAEGASSSRLTEGKAPASAEHFSASACGSSRPPDSRVTDPGGHISSHVHVFPLISGGDDAGATKAGAVGRMRGLMHTQAEGPRGRGPGAGEVLQAQSLEAWRLTAKWA